MPQPPNEKPKYLIMRAHVHIRSSYSFRHLHADMFIHIYIYKSSYVCIAIFSHIHIHKYIGTWSYEIKYSSQLYTSFRAQIFAKYFIGGKYRPVVSALCHCGVMQMAYTWENILFVGKKKKNIWKDNREFSYVHLISSRNIVIEHVGVCV